jgi:PBSX family phage terminase large subunit
MRTMMVKRIFRPSAKSRDVWRRRDEGRIRLLEGAVRSGKSYTANDLAIFEIQKLPSCNVLVSGYSITSVARNVIAEWKRAINPPKCDLFKSVREDKDEYMIINWRGLRGKKFYIRGAGKENDFMQIQGATFGYWLADELTRHCESFVDMAISRLSLEYSRATWTTNPDHPLHYAKKRFIDEAKLYLKDGTTGMAEMVRFTFYLQDNPSLSKKYLNGLENLYHGVFKQRYLYSRWVMAEGAIYDFFTTGVHTKKIRQTADIRYVGIDWGTHNPTCFLMFGRKYQPKVGEPKICLEREYYHDSVKIGQQLDTAEYAERFCDFIGHQDVGCVIYDPSAIALILSIKKALAVRGRSLVFRAANNDVIEGICTQQRMLKSGEYIIGDNNTQTIADYGAYVWDKRAALHGEDKPMKENDHTKDAERYVLHTLFGGAMIDYLSALK